MSVQKKNHSLDWRVYELTRRLILKIAMEVGPEKWMFPDNSSLAAVLQSTPQDARMLEASLRDPASSWMTPFGADFEDTERDEIRN